MDLELLQKLKNAGFPIKEETALGWTELKVPLLSELIEACGTPLDIFVTSKSTCSAHKKDLDNSVIASAYAKTPSEAVAKLWLALNKKNGTQTNN